MSQAMPLRYNARVIQIGVPEWKNEVRVRVAEHERIIWRDLYV